MLSLNPSNHNFFERNLTKLVIVSLLFVFSCSGPNGYLTHKPNKSYMGALPLSYYKLEVLDPYLAKSLLQIPDIIDGIDEADELAIEKLVKSYKNLPGQFSIVSKIMNAKGIKSIRPYDSGVEALFWIYRDEKHIDDAEEIILNFGKKSYDSILRTQLGIDIEGLLSLSWNFYDQKKWGNIEIVSRRLNAPDYISFFTDKAIDFKMHRGTPKSVHSILRDRKAECLETTIFTLYMIKKAGYYAVPVRTPGVSQGSEQHFIAAYKDNEMWFAIDNGRPVGETGIMGPYEKLENIPYEILPMPDRFYKFFP